MFQTASFSFVLSPVFSFVTDGVFFFVMFFYRVRVFARFPASDCVLFLLPLSRGKRRERKADGKECEFFTR